MIQEIASVVGLLLAMALIAHAIYSELRLSALESQLIANKQQDSDEKIHDEDHALSDDELDALITKRVGSGDKAPS